MQASAAAPAQTALTPSPTVSACRTSCATAAGTPPQPPPQAPCSGSGARGGAAACGGAPSPQPPPPAPPAPASAAPVHASRAAHAAATDLGIRAATEEPVTTTPDRYTAALKVFSDMNVVPQRGEVAAATDMAKWGKSIEQAVRDVLAKRAGGAPPVDPAAELARMLGTPNADQVAASVRSKR